MIDQAAAANNTIISNAIIIAGYTGNHDFLTAGQLVELTEETARRAQLRLTESGENMPAASVYELYEADYRAIICGVRDSDLGVSSAGELRAARQFAVERPAVLGALIDTANATALNTTQDWLLSLLRHMYVGQPVDDSATWRRKMAELLAAVVGVLIETKCRRGEVPSFADIVALLKLDGLTAAVQDETLRDATLMPIMSYLNSILPGFDMAKLRSGEPQVSSVIDHHGYLSAELIRLFGGNPSTVLPSGEAAACGSAVSVKALACSSATDALMEVTDLLVTNEKVQRELGQDVNCFDYEAAQSKAVELGGSYARASELLSMLAYAQAKRNAFGLAVAEAREAEAAGLTGAVA